MHWDHKGHERSPMVTRGVEKFTTPGGFLVYLGEFPLAHLRARCAIRLTVQESFPFGPGEAST